MNMTYKIGMIGMGSIGNRHLKNVLMLLQKKNRSFCIDIIRSGKGNPINKDIMQFIDNIYYNYEDAPSNYDIIFITNPTFMHYETIKQFVSKTKHMFIEKPVFESINVSLDTLHLKENSIYYVACPLRYTKVIQYLKQNIKLGDVFSVRVICSSYLPEWRQDQDYRDTYSAHIDQGGGVSIDLIHEWDYIYYLFGQPRNVMNIKGKFSNLEIDSDDLSIYIADYVTMAVEVHLDYFGRKNSREIQIFTEDDTIVGDLVNSEVHFLKSGQRIQFNEERNGFQIKEIEHFFDIIDGKEMNDNDINHGLKILNIVMGDK
ncbi:Predicted dehydrogenase [Anaerocolumna jejuensis DSM 15929]|uniref:Predicted dehydrogenase n=2 Tax=Anaerocolumna TaxID=1843210 RepID=A0A1M7B3T1_9FIRM|nr:Predicted dehydrogenase [Anaerocolumna jejuensis DSM 15929]